MTRRDPGEMVPAFPTNLPEAMHHLHAHHGITFDLVDASDPRVRDNVQRQIAARGTVTPTFVARLIELARLNDAGRAHDEHHLNVGMGKSTMPIPHWHRAE